MLSFIGQILHDLQLHSYLHFGHHPLQAHLCRRHQLDPLRVVVPQCGVLHRVRGEPEPRGDDLRGRRRVLLPTRPLEAVV